MSFVSIARRWLGQPAAFRPVPRRPALGVRELEDRTAPAARLVDHAASFLAAGNGTSELLGMSRDGRYVVFGSTSTNLVAGQVDTPGTSDLFWADLLTGEVKLVTNLPSLGTTGLTYGADFKTSYSTVLGQLPSFAQAVISADGKFVAFSSKINATLVDQDYISASVSKASTRTTEPDRANSSLDVFRWEAQTGQTKLASRTFDDQPNKNPSFAFGRLSEATDPSISADGSTVAFVSVLDASAALPKRNPVLPPDRVVVDRTNYEKLIRDNSTSKDVFVTDMLGAADSGGFYTSTTKFKTTVLSFYGGADFNYATSITTGRNQGLPGPDEVQPVYFTIGSKSGGDGVTVDPLGRYLAGTGFTAVFTSSMDPANLTNGDDPEISQGGKFRYATSGGSSQGRFEVYRSNLDFPASLSNNTQVVTTTGTPTTAAGVTTVRSLTSTGGTAGGGNAVIPTDDDQLVLFAASTGTAKLDPNATTGTNLEIFLRRMSSQVGADPVLISSVSGKSAAGGGTLDLDSSVTPTRVNPLSFSITPAGDRVAFASTSAGLVPGGNVIPGTTTKQAAVADTNGKLDVFVRDVPTLITTAVSVTAKGTATGPAAANNPRISADGRFVSFETAGAAGSYVTGATDANSATDAFVRDLVNNLTVLASSTASGLQAGNAGVVPGHTFVGSDSRNPRAAFASASTDLDTNFTPAQGNVGVYAVDLAPQTSGPQTDAPRTGAIAGGSLGAAAFITFNGNGQTVVGSKFSPFPGFTGELRVATADLNGDGTADLVVGAGPGAGPRVVVIDGVTGKTLRSIFAFEPTFTGGVNVAAVTYTQRDASGNPVLDTAGNPVQLSLVAVGADNGGGARVRVFDGATFAQLADFFTFEPSFRGGVRVGFARAGTIGADGLPTTTDPVNVPDLIAGAGVGGGPRVRVFDGAAVRLGRLNEVANFFAYENTLRNGVYVAGGDFNGDGIDDIVAGAGPDGGPRVSVFDARSAVLGAAATPDRLLDFFAFDPNSRNGVRVAVKNIDGDGVPDIVAGEGAGSVSRVRSFAGGNLDDQDRPIQLDDFVAFDDFSSLNGANVG